MPRLSHVWPLSALFLGLCGCGRGEVGASGKSFPKGPAKRVVLITCDALRVDRMSTYGYARPTTPRIDALAGESVTFTNAWTTSPTTLPALASMLTGSLPSEVGVTTDADTAMAADVTTIAELMREAGFATAAVVSNGVLRVERGDVGIQQGFTTYDANMSPPPAGQARMSRSGQDSTTAALHWLAEPRADADRFFLWVHYSDPYGPYAPPEEHLALFRRDHPDEADLPVSETDSGAGAIPRFRAIEGVRKPGDYMDRYDAAVHAFDEAVGRIVDDLKGRGWLDDALVVLTSDHGVSFGEHGYWFSHGETLQRELVHVPLIVKPPKELSEALSTDGGRRNGKLAMHLDIFPTVLAATGIDGPSVRGISLLEDRLPEGRIAPQTLARGDASLDMLAITDGRWRLVSTGPLVPILYDVLSDPLETRNVAGKNAHITKRLTDRWREFMRRTDAQVPSGSN